MPVFGPTRAALAAAAARGADILPSLRVVLTAEALTGLFAGIFVGCLALAIAEMLDSIPILTRRIGFRHGLGLMVISIAMGKAVGSLLYFWHPIFR